MMDTTVYWLWLQNALGVGAQQSEALIDAYGTAKAVHGETAYSPSLKLSDTQYRRLLDKDLSKAIALYERMSQSGVWILTPEDTLYTALFDTVFAPPVVIYGKGERFDPSDAPLITVVGTRHCDRAGLLVTRRLGAGLAAGGAIVVTGGAEGLDSEALSSALDAGGRCISFQACGIDVEYPKSVAALRRRLIDRGGMLLSEFPPGTPAFRHHFRIRNRLLGAVSRGTLVTQAPKPSGALMTANWAREQGRDVYACPGAVGVSCSVGSNELLKEGATLVTAAADILMEYIEWYPSVVNIQAAVLAEERAAVRFEQEYGEEAVALSTPSYETRALPRVAQPEPPSRTYAPCPADADDDMKRLYEALKDEARTASQLSRDLGVPLPKVLSALTRMELRATVTCGAGQRYAVNTDAQT